MSQLIQMRQRIKAVTTIKKITSAMRLISRSMHTKLDKQKKPLVDYRTTLCSLFSFVKNFSPEWSNPRLFPLVTDQKKKLFIIIGSQKGLCGNFNSGIFYWIDAHRTELMQSETTIICLSKKISDYLHKRTIPYESGYPEIKTSNLYTVTNTLIDKIIKGQATYTDVIVISTVSKSFFNHETRILPLIPFIGCAPDHNLTVSDYVWEHEKTQVLEVLAENVLTISLRTAIFESLHAEQSARFISMDNATRNANNFLDSMKLHYNKARQAKITKELSELIGSDISSF